MTWESSWPTFNLGPLPDKWQSRGTFARLYSELDRLEVGQDGIFVVCDEQERVRAAIVAHARRQGRRFKTTSRTTGMNVWRDA